MSESDLNRLMCRCSLELIIDSTYLNITRIYVPEYRYLDYGSKVFSCLVDSIDWIVTKGYNLYSHWDTQKRYA